MIICLAERFWVSGTEINIMPVVVKKMNIDQMLPLIRLSDCEQKYLPCLSTEFLGKLMSILIALNKAMGAYMFGSAKS